MQNINKRDIGTELFIKVMTEPLKANSSDVKLFP